MALQNRVTPFGEIIATPERGTLMGNRGGRIHHNHEQRLTNRRWASWHWIACRLEFKGWHREVMSPNTYTELFFLDEATALAAGHRPCALCRRDDFQQFMAAWAAGSPSLVPNRPLRAGDVDAVLHGERAARRGEKMTYVADLGSLPDGAMVELPEDPGRAWLLWSGCLHEWTAGGYRASRAFDLAQQATVLTPRSIVRALGAGYAPAVHGSRGPLGR